MNIWLCSIKCNEKILHEQEVHNLFIFHMRARWHLDDNKLQHIMKIYCELELGRETQIFATSAQIAELLYVAKKIGFTQDNFVLRNFVKEGTRTISDNDTMFFVQYQYNKHSTPEPRKIIERLYYILGWDTNSFDSDIHKEIDDLATGKKMCLSSERTGDLIAALSKLTRKKGDVYLGNFVIVDEAINPFHVFDISYLAG